MMLRKLFLALALLAIPAASFAQEQPASIADLQSRIERVEQSLGIEQPQLAVADEPQFSVQSSRIDRDQIASLIIEANRHSSLGRLQKNRIERIMSSPFRTAAKERAIDKVAQQLLDDGALEVTPDSVQAAIDIEQIILIVERLLPIVLQILSLFGA